MLHFHDTINFQARVNQYFQTISTWIDHQKSKGNALPIMYLFNIGDLETEKLTNEDKIQHMTNDRVEEYNMIIHSQLQEFGFSEMITLFDIRAILNAAGKDYSIDGIHPNQDITKDIMQVLFYQISEDTRRAVSVKPSNQTSPSKFVGRYPVLGLFVGIYIFAVLITGDVFLITHLLMDVFG